MLKYLPFIVVAAIALPLTAVQWKMMDWVWGANTPAVQCAYLMETEVPREFGDWVGVDRVVSKEILDTAGADGYIDRVYTNTRTNDQVSIWLIVGHFRQVARHTPNICYRAAGYEQLEKESMQKIDVPDLPTSTFRTAKFTINKDGNQYYQRVFWAWWKPEELKEGESAEDINIAWAGPEDPRLKFGFCRALYKLYFTSNSTAEERPDESVCLEFAEEFLPIVQDCLRTSGVVMVNEELPADVDDVLKRNQQDTDQSKDTNDAPSESAKEEDADQE